MAVIKVEPKTVTSTYRGFTLQVTYRPEDGRWVWIAKKPVQSFIDVRGNSATASLARIAAQRAVDKYTP